MVCRETLTLKVRKSGRKFSVKYMGVYCSASIVKVL